MYYIYGNITSLSSGPDCFLPMQVTGQNDYHFFLTNYRGLAEGWHRS